MAAKAAADHAHEDGRRELRGPLGLGGGPGRAVDLDVAVTIDLGDEPGRHHRRRVVLLDDRRPLDPVAGPEQRPVVEGRRPALGPPADVEYDLTLHGLRAAGVAVSGLCGRGLELRDPADPDDADVDDLDLGVEAVAVLRLVRAVEGLLQLLHPGRVDLACRDVEANLVALARVATVGEATQQAPVLGDAVLLELGDRLRRHLVVAALQPLPVDPLYRLALGGDELVLEVGGEQAGRRDDPGVRRD